MHGHRGERRKTKMIGLKTATTGRLNRKGIPLLFPLPCSKTKEREKRLSGCPLSIIHTRTHTHTPHTTVISSCGTLRYTDARLVRAVQQRNGCARWPMRCFTYAVKHKHDSATAMQLMPAGYRNWFGRAKTIVDTNDSSSNRFCSAASVDEKRARIDAGVSCLKKCFC